MRKILMMPMMASVMMMAASCSSDDDNDPIVEPETDQTAVLQASANKMFVQNTVQPTYEGLSQSTLAMINALEAFDASGAQSDLDKAAQAWKDARQYWEWSEAFLFGAASGYGIDPHIDTWPFDAASFNTYMSKYNPATDEDDAALMEEAIATGQNLTGFHAVEYLIFRDGKVRPAAELTADETWFCIAASQDLFLSASKLVAAWNGEVSTQMQEALDEAEFECDSFGEEFINAGQAGSRWSTVKNASVNIIEGAQDIIDEVAHSKIGAPYTGENVNYIESPHAWNSITDFYDNIMSVKNALYGFSPTVANYSNANPAPGSLMAYCQTAHTAQASATMAALEKALKMIDGMKKPFVNNYTDASAGAAIEALEELDEELGKLKKEIDE